MKLLLVSIFFNFALFANAYGETGDLGEILVIDSAEQQSEDKPSAFVHVIDAKKIQSSHAALPELLREEASVLIQSQGGLGQSSTLRLRGSSPEQVLILMDGVRMNSAQGFAVDLSTIPMAGVERIEVLRGASSTRFGSDAIGGVVNIITKKAQGPMQSHLVMTGSSFSSLKLETGLSKAQKKWSWKFDLSHQRTQGDFQFTSNPLLIGGVRFGGGQKLTRLHNASHNEQAFLRFDFDPKKDWKISVSNQFSYLDRELPGPEASLITAASLNAKQNILRNLTALKIVKKNFIKKDLELSFKPSFLFTRDHFQDVTPSLGPALDSVSLNSNQENQLGLNYFKEGKKVFQEWTALYTLTWDYFKDEQRSGLVATGSKNRVSNALFVENEMTLFGEKLVLNPSTRFQHSSDFGISWSAHMGLIYRPKETFYVKANLENAFRVPSFSELYLPDMGFIRGDPNLNKEKSWNIDFGVGFENDQWTLELVYFRNDIQDSIVFVPVSAFTIAPVNTRGALNQGIEAKVEYQPKDFLELSANYTFLHATLDQSGNFLPGRAKHQANAKIKFIHDRATLFSHFSYVHDLPIDFANTTFIRNKFYWDLGATLKLAKIFFIQATVKNILNQQSLDKRGYPLPGRSAYLSFGYRS